MDGRRNYQYLEWLPQPNPIQSQSGTLQNNSTHTLGFSNNYSNSGLWHSTRGQDSTNSNYNPWGSYYKAPENDPNYISISSFVMSLENSSTRPLDVGSTIHSEASSIRSATNAYPNYTPLTQWETLSQKLFGSAESLFNPGNFDEKVTNVRNNGNLISADPNMYHCPKNTKENLNWCPPHKDKCDLKSSTGASQFFVENFQVTRHFETLLNDETLEAHSSLQIVPGITTKLGIPTNPVATKVNSYTKLNDLSDSHELGSLLSKSCRKRYRSPSPDVWFASDSPATKTKERSINSSIFFNADSAQSNSYDNIMEKTWTNMASSINQNSILGTSESSSNQNAYGPSVEKQLYTQESISNNKCRRFPFQNPPYSCQLEPFQNHWPQSNCPDPTMKWNNLDNIQSHNMTKLFGESTSKSAVIFHSDLFQSGFFKSDQGPLKEKVAEEVLEVKVPESNEQEQMDMPEIPFITDSQYRPSAEHRLFLSNIGGENPNDSILVPNADLPQDLNLSPTKSTDSSPSRKKEPNIETNVEILKRRQKQIDYGKNTVEYKRYASAISKCSRSSRDLWTPDRFIKYSRRSWDSQIKIWRKKLHEWDP